MYGVMTPQHLHRLGLINDSVLFTYPTVEDIAELLDEDEHQVTNENTVSQTIDNTNQESNTKWVKEDTFRTRDGKPTLNKLITSDDILLLKQALNKIPQIPFALVIDEYRWKYFEGGLGKRVNEEFWDLTTQLQGIAPPEARDEENFDAGAKYHVPDNTPFIRQVKVLTRIIKKDLYVQTFSAQKQRKRVQSTKRYLHQSGRLGSIYYEN